MIDNRTLRHDLHNLLYAVKAAYKNLLSETPDLRLVEQNVKAALEKLEELTALMSKHREGTK